MTAQKVTAKSPTAERVWSRQLLAAALQNGGYRPLSDGMEPPSFAGLLAQDIIKDIARLHLRCELLDPVPDFRPKRADLPQLFGCSRIMRRVGYTLPNCAVTVFVGDRPQMLQALNLQLGTALADHVEERRHDFLVPFTNSGGGDTATRRSSSNISSSSESSVRR